MPGAGHDRQRRLFAAIARSTGNPEHGFALAALTERLEPIQRIEDAFLDHTEGETAEIFRAIRTGDRKELRRSLVRYHRRRERIVPQLLESLLHG
jgi:DNA-binding FadR family transcriptional regulator